MYDLYEIRDWIYECELFLFLAEVHFIDVKVSPVCHEFFHVLSGSELEEMLAHVEKRHCSCMCMYSYIQREELDDLKSVMDHIASEQWDQLSSDKIVQAQDVLQKLASGLRNTIIKAHKERGHPQLYSGTEG
ncbi:hypothetical protein [Methanomethylovorans sp.]|uniref:hypothetical protein n=1 Tax=Methanomethylovorans sp. TaxID=2758717 RepID=UPI00345EBF73